MLKTPRRALASVPSVASVVPPGFLLPLVGTQRQALMEAQPPATSQPRPHSKPIPANPAPAPHVVLPEPPARVPRPGKDAGPLPLAGGLGSSRALGGKSCAGLRGSSTRIGKGPSGAVGGSTALCARPELENAPGKCAGTTGVTRAPCLSGPLLQNAALCAPALSSCHLPGPAAGSQGLASGSGAQVRASCKARAASASCR